MIATKFDMKTVTRKRYNYSNRERAILSAFGKPGRKIKTNDLIDKVYGADAPINARPALITTLGILMRKVEHNRESFRIMRNGGRGPTQHEWWMEMRS